MSELIELSHRPTRTTMTTETTSSSTRVCDTCKETINADAVVCPHCGAYRSDVKSSIDMWWKLQIVRVGVVALGVIGFFANFWSKEVVRNEGFLTITEYVFDLRTFFSSATAIGLMAVFLILSAVIFKVGSNLYKLTDKAYYKWI